LAIFILAVTGNIGWIGSVTIPEERKKIESQPSLLIKMFPDLKSPDEIPKAFSEMTGYAVKGTFFEKNINSS
jgi:hypothetical protein